jgi:toxin-antitoxin system PIN domain toxin
MTLVDVNLLVYAFQPASPHHEAARSWLDALRERPFWVADEALLGFMRIVTNSRIFATPSTVAEALEFVAALRGSPGWRELPRTATRWATLQRVCDATGARAAGLSDAWLAVLALEQDAVLASADRDFAAIPGLRWLNPLD